MYLQNLDISFDPIRPTPFNLYHPTPPEHGNHKSLTISLSVSLSVLLASFPLSGYLMAPLLLMNDSALEKAYSVC
jgi:hypothetical protein